MSILIDDCSAALVALPRLRSPFAGVRPDAVDAQPRLTNLVEMPTTAGAWRLVNGSTTRGYETAAQQGTKDGRSAFAGTAYVTTAKHSTRSGPPTSRPPA